MQLDIVYFFTSLTYLVIATSLRYITNKVFVFWAISY